MLRDSFDHAAVVTAFPELTVDPDPLGCGGMKNAYRISNNGSDAVLKIIREPLRELDENTTTGESAGSITLPGRMKREIEGMRKIDHPGIVTVVDGPHVREIAGEQRVWYVEPFYSGGTLADRIGTPWPHEDVIRLIVSLADAVEVLSSHGIVHRDIKPPNIVFGDDSQPVLLDLGIAYFVDLTPLTNGAGMSPRTDVYAAPEQFEVRREALIDFRTDLFQIGIVAFEALTTVHPFTPANADGYFDRLLNGQIDEQALATAGVPECVQDVLRRLLAPAMSRRFRKISFLREHLEDCR